jgi:molybdate transport system permease protein
MPHNIALQRGHDKRAKISGVATTGWSYMKQNVAAKVDPLQWWEWATFRVSIKRGFRVENMVLSSEEWEAVWLTLMVAARAVGFGLPVAVLVAWVLARWRFPGRGLLNALVHLPMVLPPVVTGWLLLVLFGIRGPIGLILDHWLGVRLAFSTAGASLACATMTFPIMVRSVRLSLDAVDAGLEQAARTLGAGWLDRLFNITLPLASPGILVGGIVAYATCLGEFGAVITFAANIPGQTQTLPLAIYAALQEPGGETKAAGLSLVSLTLALVGLLLSEWMGKRLKLILGR